DIKDRRGRCLFDSLRRPTPCGRIVLPNVASHDNGAARALCLHGAVETRDKMICHRPVRLAIADLDLNPSLLVSGGEIGGDYTLDLFGPANVEIFGLYRCFERLRIKVGHCWSACWSSQSATPLIAPSTLSRLYPLLSSSLTNSSGISRRMTASVYRV